MARDTAKHVFLVVTFALLGISQAQTFTGTIVGRIFDPRHAPIANASIMLVSLERGFERHTSTNERGEYTFELVPPGRYYVRVESSGFAAADIKVEAVIAKPVRVDLVLRLQQVHEQIQVIGEGGISVQTENADLGRVISPREVTELPSLGRSLYDFVALIPGATLSNDAIGIGFAVNGGRTQSANYLLDGSENNEISMSAPAMDVPLDSIQEFNVQTNHFSAEYGRNSSFTANIITKSGTTFFHGSIYDYVRNSALAANTFDNNAHNLPRPIFNRHQFGGTAGGPIKKGKLFFFASTEGILVRSNGANNYYVPTPDLLAISAPGTQAIFERFPLPTNLSATDVTRETLCPFGASCDFGSGSGMVRIAAFAFTTRVGPHDFGAGPPQDTLLATGRLDWIHGAKTQAFVRYAIETKDEFALASQPYSKELDQPLYGHNQNSAIDLIHTWSPTFITESRVAYDRVTGDPDRFGGDGYPTPAQPFPSFGILNEPVSLPGGIPGAFGPTHRYQFFQTTTYSRGTHLLRFGGQFLHLRQDYTFGIAGQVADAQFDNTQSFVDGMMNRYSLAVNPKGHSSGEFLSPPFEPPSFSRHYHYNEPAFFFTDTWKIRSRLTLTPGLRWEYFGVFHSPGDEHILDSNFYPGKGANFLVQITNGQMLRTIDAPGHLQKHFYLPDYRNFAPRMGLAYDLLGDGKTVLRAGGGIFYDRRVGWELFRAFQNPPAYNFIRLTNVSLTPAIVVNQYAAFPNAPLLLTGSLVHAPILHMRSAYVGSWNATLEREVSAKLVAGLSYVGSSGNKLYSVDNINRVGSGGLLDASCLTNRMASDGTTSIGPSYLDCPHLNTSLNNIQLKENGGHSSYHALQARIDSGNLSRFGIEFGGNYTWSHSIDNRSVSALSASVAETGSGYLDAFHPALDRGSSDFDVRHRFAAHCIWDIPGPAFSDSAARHFTQGWQVSGFLSYQTGQPFSIADLATPDWSGERTRPRLTGSLPRTTLIPDVSAPNNYLFLPINQVYDPLTGKCIADAAPFACEISVNGPFQHTLPRNTFQQPGLFFLNTALSKNFSLTSDRLKIQFRAEFYNPFNHANLYIVGTSTDVSTSSFTNSDGIRVPGVTAAFRDNRQIVLALKLIY